MPLNKKKEMFLDKKLSLFTDVLKRVSSSCLSLLFCYFEFYEGVCCVMVIVGGNGHGDTSSNPGRG